MLDLNEHVKRQNDENSKWQASFLEKYEDNQKRIIEELDAMRKIQIKNRDFITYNMGTLKEHQRKMDITDVTIKEHGDWLKKV